MAKKSNRPNVTNNTTNIVSVGGVGSDSFNALLQLQEKSVENLQTISAAMKSSVAAQRVLAIESLILSKESLEEQRILKDVSKTLERIANSLKDVLAASIVSSGGSASSSNTPTAIATQSKEDKNETQRAEEEKTDLLRQIAKNTAKKDKAVTPSKEEGSGLGGWLTALAAALGVVVGALKAQVKAIAYFAKLLTPDFVIAKVQKALAGFLAGVSMTFDMVKLTISEKLSTALKFVDNAIDAVKVTFTGIADSIKGVFNVGKEGSAISKVIKAITSGIGTVMAPFAEAFNIIKDFVSGPVGKIFESIKSVVSSTTEGTKGFFTTLSETFGKFGSVFKSVATIAEKIFLPLTIIMTVWDTVKGSIEGYEKEGIVGAITGAIKGFFNSLIFGPIDMLKDAIAWVSGFFGFENAKKTLESFSVEKIFSDFVDMIFSPVKTFKTIVNSITQSLAKLSDFTIPEIGFTIPYINKKVSVGPWKPLEGFANAGSSSGETVSPSNVAPPASTSTSATVASQSSEVGALREKSSGNTTIVSAPSVSNNMQQTQVAKIEAPIRSNDSSFDRYLQSRVVY